MMPSNNIAQIVILRWIISLRGMPLLMGQNKKNNNDILKTIIAWSFKFGQLMED